MGEMLYRTTDNAVSRLLGDFLNFFERSIFFATSCS